MTEMTRRLAAILSADITGYSRLMSLDEASTIRALTARRQQVALLIEHHRGRLVDFVGDSFMAEFASAVDAVECAMEIQQVGVGLNASLPPDRRLEFRIGLHLGEVQAHEDRIFGTGVNIAARLHQLGEPGGVYISGEVQRQVEGRTRYSFRDLGEHSVKNIPDPVHAYAVSTPNVDAPVAPAEPARQGARGWAVVATVVIALGAGGGLWAWNQSRTAGGIVDRGSRGAAETSDLPKKLVVLPFEDLSPEGDQGYLAEGVSDELVVELASTPGLEVKGRMTGASVRKLGLSVEEVAEQTGVTGIVDGSVRKSGDRLRISVHVIAVPDGRNVWSETYDRPLEDIFSLQRDIAAQVSGALRSGAPAARRAAASSFEAYEHLLAANRLAEGFSEKAMQDSVAHAEAAIAVDPKNAAAYAITAQMLVPQCHLGYTPCDDAYRRAEAALDRAMDLDPDLPRAWIATSTLLAARYEWARAEAAARRAIELDPEDVYGHVALAGILVAVGRTDEGFASYERAVELDPLNPAVLSRAGNALSAVRGDHARALELFERIDRIDSGDVPPVRAIAEILALGRAGRLDDAVASLPKLGLPPPMVAGLSAKVKSGGATALFDGIAKLGAATSGRPCLASTALGATLRAMSGDDEGALACLEEGIENNSLLEALSLYAQTWDGLRGDPRFEAIRQKMNLVDAEC